MVYLRDKYVYHHTRKRKKGKTLKVAVSVLCSIVLIFAVVLVITGVFNNKNRADNKQESSIKDLWSAKNYNQVIEICDALLEKNPLNPRVLAYKGFSCFYKADSEIENKNFYYDKAIMSLRKSLLSTKTIFKKEIFFILGMTYFYKGKFYYELAVKYIEKSIGAGYESPDALIRLGLAYGLLGKGEKELECLLEAVTEGSTDWLYLLIGKSYFKISQFDKAEEYLIRYINRTDDVKTEQEARFRLGEIYFEREDYLKAEEQYKEILKLNNRSANAHFNLGEIYYKLNDNVKSRAEWRQTLIIDPSHRGAKLRYYK